jgi:mono/diheme cytochrome c family protein
MFAGVLVLLACESQDGAGGPDQPDDPPASPSATPTQPGSDALGNPFSTPDSTSGILGGLGGLTGASGTFSGLIGGLGGAGGAIDPADQRPPRLAQLRTSSSPPPTISGGTLAVSADGKQVVAADSDRDLVYVIDPAALKVQRINLARGSEPGRVALDRNGGAHVALRGTSKLVRIDLARAAVSTETATCSHPRGVAFDAKNNLIVVSCMDGQVLSLDPVSHRESSRLSYATDLRDVVVNAAGARWITRYRSAELLTFAGDSVKNVTRPAQATRPRFLGGGDLALDVLPGVDDAGVTVIQPPSPNVTLSPTLAWRALANQRGGVWMLHQQSQDDEVVITRGGYGGGCQTITSGAVTEFDADGTPLRTLATSLSGLSVDAALSPDEKWLAIASPGGFARGGSTVQVYATTSQTPNGSAFETPNGMVPTCPNPLGSAASENQTVAVAFDGAGLLYALSREPAELQLYELQVIGSSSPFFTTQALPMRLATIALDTRSVRDTGHDLFHADVGQGLACASCHGEVLDDGHVWNFQKIGPRRTQNMRGGFLTTAPFHWDGDMMSMSHLVDDVMTGRMGGFPVELSFATALGQWLQQQPALTLPARDAAAVARGKELFGSAQVECASCHSGSNLTNNESRDVGTGGKFQVPSLLGLALRPPYMHNGCAKTLLERFDAKCGGGDAHGKTSQLSDAQRLDLVAYLDSL